MYKRQILLISLMLFLTINLFSQIQRQNDSLYLRETTEDVIQFHDWSISYNNSTYTIEGGHSSYVYSRDFECISWSYNDPEEGINISARKRGNTIRIQGTSNGERIDIEHRMNNGFWNQASMLLGPIQCLWEDEDRITFYVIRPDDFSLNEMEGRVSNNEVITVDGERYETNHLIISLTGFLSGFWQADYWYNQETDQLLRCETHYGPFAPLTVLEVIR